MMSVNCTDWIMFTSLASQSVRLYSRGYQRDETNQSPDVGGCECTTLNLEGTLCSVEADKKLLIFTLKSSYMYRMYTTHKHWIRLRRLSSLRSPIGHTLTTSHQSGQNIYWESCFSEYCPGYAGLGQSNPQPLICSTIILKAGAET